MRVAEKNNLNMPLLTIENEARTRNFIPSAFLAFCADHLGIRSLLEKQAVREGYSVGEHTVMLLTQSEKYFGGALPGLTSSCSRILEMLHDAGKRISENTFEQHENTLRLLQDLRTGLPVSDQEFQIIFSVIGNKSLGSIIYKATGGGPNADIKVPLAEKLAAGTFSIEELREFVNMTKQELFGQDLEPYIASLMSDVEEASPKTGLSPSEYLLLLTAYYQLDTSCYTTDAARDLTHTFPNSERYTLSPSFVTFRADLSQRYAELEEKAPRRAYPSLDGLFVVRADASLEGNPSTDPLFEKHPSENRLLFSSSLEPLFCEVQRRVANLSRRKVFTKN
jgi:hypothetical protein